jgi:hypothetical protein
VIDLDDIMRIIGRLYLESQASIEKVNEENRKLKAELAKQIKEERAGPDESA